MTDEKKPPRRNRISLQSALLLGVPPAVFGTGAGAIGYDMAARSTQASVPIVTTVGAGMGTAAGGLLGLAVYLRRRNEEEASQVQVPFYPTSSYEDRNLIDKVTAALTPQSFGGTEVEVASIKKRCAEDLARIIKKVEGARARLQEIGDTMPPMEQKILFGQWCQELKNFIEYGNQNIVAEAPIKRARSSEPVPEGFKLRLRRSEGDAPLTPPSGGRVQQGRKKEIGR